jgi:type IV secretion system protein VirB10
MTSEPGPTTPQEQDRRDHETLELRARPRPVTRINRKLLAGVVGLGLLLLAGLVMMALNPPSWRGSALPTELYNVDNKPKSDSLARLPATYADLAPSKKDAPKGLGAPQLTDPDAERIDAERGRLAKQVPRSSVCP